MTIERLTEGRRLIVVLGMHRSGTSAITRALRVFGVDLGNNLIPGDARVNKKGFFEDVDINALNVELLSTIRHDWMHVRMVSESDFVELKKRFLDRACELLKEKVKGKEIYGFKDPRVAKLIPFWRDVFDRCGYIANYVIALRNPMSVVKSLEKRDKLDITQSYLLWLEYMLSILNETMNDKRILVNYDFLMQTPVDELRRIGSALSFPVYDEKESEYFVNHFLSPNLRHSVHTKDDLLLEAPPLVYEVYSVLCQVGIDSQEFIQHIEKWLKERARLSLLVKLLDRFYFINRVLISERDAVVAERDAVVKQIKSITNSRSWRITAPLRSMTRFVK
jgi:hypothetical protein